MLSYLNINYFCRPKKGSNTPKKSASRGRSTGRRSKQDEWDGDQEEQPKAQKKGSGTDELIMFICLLADKKNMHTRNWILDSSIGMFEPWQEK